MTRETEQKPANLLLDNLELLQQGMDTDVPVLDLACGNGRNGLELAARGIGVVFADHSAESLRFVEQQLAARNLSGRLWQVDLEEEATAPLAGARFSSILVFRYLHRPLFPALLHAVIPGGLIIYETFTTANRRFGRPNNPRFLLKPGELKAIFRNWETIHYFEGLKKNPDRAVAQIVTRKP
ncbi:MAG: methyltransferase domain-containing protein [Xanthomonadales bacterium]|nr:methyltransferase domain-containing protein [Gammaproteobacteria bacterium]NNK04497.1 methyltransferase domain-containing protein [Xanthomonadales bacterium]